jgi:hypothetical protein
MKPPHLLIAVVVGLLLDSPSLGESARRRILIPPPVTGSVVKPEASRSLQAPFSFDLAGGKSLKIVESETGTAFLDGAGNNVYSLESPLVARGVRECAVSPAKTCVVLLIAKTQGGMSWYDHTLIIRSEEGKFVFEKVFPVGVEIDPGKDVRPFRVGAISDDGKTILAEFILTDVATGKMTSEWQTWEVLPAKRLGRGLTIANGVRSD